MTERTESALLKLAGVFLILFAIILTLSPTVRERSWDVAYRWSHWVGLLAWMAIFAFAHVEIKRHLPDHDPYLLPIAALMTGWGLLTIWRLTPGATLCAADLWNSFRVLWNTGCWSTWLFAKARWCRKQN